jgi:hypothetical protein
VGSTLTAPPRVSGRPRPGTAPFARRSPAPSIGEAFLPTS